MTSVLLEALTRWVEADRLTTKHHTTDRLERKLLVALRRTWRAQKRAVLAELVKHWALFVEAAMRAEDLPVDLPDRSITTDAELVAVMEALAADAFDAGATHVIAELALTGNFDLTVPAAADWMRHWGAARVTGIDEVTRARLRRLLVDAVERNWSYQQTARQITRLFDGFSGLSPLGHIRNRAELVSVTEIGDAYEYGGRIMADQLAATGLWLQKQWLTASSDVCPTCSDAAAQGWIEDGVTFDNGLDGPLGHPGCRCALARRVTPTTKPARRP